MNSPLFKDISPIDESQDSSFARAISIDPQARPLGAPKRSNVGYGNSFLREPEFGACDLQHQERLATLDRQAGIR